MQLVIGVKTEPESKKVCMSTLMPQFEIEEGNRRVVSSKRIRIRISSVMRGEYIAGKGNDKLGDSARTKDISKRLSNADSTFSKTITYEEIAGFVAERGIRAETAG